jgi:hypothetical protein
MEGTEGFDAIHGHRTFEVILKSQLLEFRNRQASRAKAQPGKSQSKIYWGDNGIKPCPLAEYSASGQGFSFCRMSAAWK